MKAEFGGDDDLLTNRDKRFAHEFFVGEGSIDLGRVEKGHASVHGGPHERNHLLPVSGRTIVDTQAHTTEPESRNLQSTVPKGAILHHLPFHLAGVFSHCFCPRLLRSLSGLVLLIADLLHPIGGCPIKPFGNGDMGQGRGWCGTVPMFFPWLKPNHDPGRISWIGSPSVGPDRGRSS